MYYKLPLTKFIKYGNFKLPNFKMAKWSRNGIFRSQEIQGDIKICLAHNIQVSSKAFSQNISNYLSFFVYLLPKIRAEKFQKFPTSPFLHQTASNLDISDGCHTLIKLRFLIWSSCKPYTHLSDHSFGTNISQQQNLAPAPTTWT